MAATDDPTANEMKAAAAAFERLAGELVHLGLEVTKRQRLDFLPQAEAKRKREQLFDLRDSIRHRAHSLLWHLGGLHQGRDDVRKRSGENFIASLDSGGDPRPLLRYIRLQFFLFDDVIFNMLSLFDYLGNLVGTVRLKKERLLWQRVAKLCGRNVPPVESSLASLIVAAHNGWVKRMEDFRADLIHHEARLGEGQSSTDLNTLLTTWHVWLPDELKTQLPGPLATSVERVDVADGAAVLVQRSLDCAADIVHAVWDTYPWAPAPWEKKAAGLPA